MTLLAEIEGFLAQSGMSATAFGIDALNDPGFVPGLRAGRDPKLSTAERVRAFIVRKREDGNGDHVDGDTAPAPAPSPGDAGEISPLPAERAA